MVNLKDSTVFDYIRYVGSFALLMFSTVVTFYAILEQKTSFWKAVPGWAALIIFLLVLFLLGVMEGIQVLQGLCHAFLNTALPRLPWLSSSGRTQKLTKKAIHRLTGLAK